MPLCLKVFAISARLLPDCQIRRLGGDLAIPLEQNVMRGEGFVKMNYTDRAGCTTQLRIPNRNKTRPHNLIGKL